MFWKSWANAALSDEGDTKTSARKGIEESPEAPLFAEFLAGVNHDLRTPLNAVIGFAQIIESEMYGEVSPQYLEYARHIQESGYELLSKIENLMELTDQAVAEEAKRASPTVVPLHPRKKLAAAE